MTPQAVIDQMKVSTTGTTSEHHQQSGESNYFLISQSSLKGCQGLCNLIQYQYSSSNTETTTAVGPAAVGLAVITVAETPPPPQ